MATDKGATREVGGAGGAELAMQRTADAAARHAYRRFRALADQVDSELAELTRQKARNDAAGPTDVGETHVDARLTALQALAPNRQRLDSAYKRELGRARERFLAGERYSRQPETDLEADAWMLQLVGDDQLEEQLAVERMAARALRHYEDPLYQIGTRVTRCARAAGLRRDAHPLEPGVMSETFAAALATLGLGLDTRLRILGLFEQKVLGDLETLYGEIDEILTAAGLPPSGPAPETGSEPADATFECQPATDQSFENALEKARAGDRLTVADGIELLTTGTDNPGIDQRRK
ncbi:MAG: DUF1631 family protein, partial [Rhodosalinus sp.]